MKWLLASGVAFVLAFVPALAFAAEDEDSADVLVRIGADVVVPADQTIGSVIVIDGNALIQGTVRDVVLVISGNAVVSGRIDAELTVISGDI
jgi:cytoskeletal protein CcmA (bactofilin family)